MKLSLTLILLVGALAGCSSSAPPPYISPNTEGLRTINPTGYESRFCTTGTQRRLGGIAKMPDATQYAIGKCNVNLFDKENTLFIFLGEDTEMSDYAEAELDAYLHPKDYIGPHEKSVQGAPGAVPEQLDDLKARGALVNFDVDSDVPLSISPLQRVAQIMRISPTKIVVIGHADSTYTEAHNLPLSVRRAKKVKEILVSFGVPEDKISVAGKSSREPIDTNETEQGRAKNRRAEVKGE